MGVKMADRIAKLLEEHESKRNGLLSLDAFTNDLEPISRLKEFAKRIESERLAVGPWPLQLEEDVSSIQIRLSDHFSKEEEVLAECCKIFDDTGLADVLAWLRTTHQAIMKRLDNLREKVRQIVPTISSQGDWIELAFDARERLIETRVLLEKHAEEEEMLFRMLKNRLASHSD